MVIPYCRDGKFSKVRIRISFTSDNFSRKEIVPKASAVLYRATFITDNSAQVSFLQSRSGP